MSNKTQVVLFRDVDEKSVEEIFKMAMNLSGKPPYSPTGLPRTSAAEAGFRMVLARDPRTLLVLEKCANILSIMAERQTGETRRQESTEYALKFEPFVVDAFKKAYTTSDAGTPTPELSYFYAAAGWFAGNILP